MPKKTLNLMKLTVCVCSSNYMLHYYMPFWRHFVDHNRHLYYTAIHNATRGTFKNSLLSFFFFLFIATRYFSWRFEREREGGPFKGKKNTV